MAADQPSPSNNSSLWRRLTDYHHRQQLTDYNDDDSLVYSVSVGELHSQHVADISSLRTLELIRQLSFDTSMPKIIDMCDTEGVPSNIRRLAPQVISPPLHHVDLNRVYARSKTPSEISDSEGGYVADVDEMVIRDIHRQTGLLPNRRRLACSYAVSSVSDDTSCDDHSFTSSSESESYCDDPTTSNSTLGIHHVDVSELEDDLLGPPLCTRLSTDSLLGWDLLCEEEGDAIDKMRYISTALSSSSLVCDLATSYTSKGYTQTKQGEGVWNSDHSTASGSTLRSTHYLRPRIDLVQQEYDEAIASAGYLAFTGEATEKQEADSQPAAPQDQGKKALRRKSFSLFKKNKTSSCSVRATNNKNKSYKASKKSTYPLSPDRTVATSLASCCSNDDQEYFTIASSFRGEVPTF
ncbi:hypothetical protein QTG54_016366 [Skeletonema marinoi]|uniref:Uncharacterized protein n=1 Tax=Skeletonema marinoi TaxID=267567 RepID=A0AAD9D4X3_9STRA|nr:hypothetical protein QTG54_016366 [Skeletonema marinoi]